MPYQPYRGVRKRRKGKMILSFTLLALVAAVVLFFVAQEYVVFTAEGFRFVFPFMSDTSTPTSEPVPPDETVTVEIVDTSLPTSAPTAPTTTVPSFAKSLTSARLAALGGNTDGDALAAAVYVKDFDGVYMVPQPGKAETSDQRDTLELLVQGGPAIFSAMRDAVGPRSNRAAAITTASGATWLDYNYISWYNPYSCGAVLTDAVSLCMDSGISELIFTNLQFPTRGRLEYINLGDNDSPQSRVNAITGLLEQCREYIDSHGGGIFLSVLLTDTAAEQYVDEAAGQDVRELAKYCDILYVSTANADYDINPLLDLVQGTDCRIGLWLNSSAAPDRQIDFVLLK